MSVNDRFKALLSNITLTDDQRADGAIKHHGVRQCLNKYYWDSTSETANSMLIGSWGKSTRVRPPRDVDVLFQLPHAVYQRFQTRIGNKQSALLQEVKSVLQKTYQTTDMRGDGQVVVVPFTSFRVEVVPAFLLDSGQYWICNTHDGGKYVATDPKRELEKIDESNKKTGNNTRDLVRMMKCWQQECSVPIKSFHIELLAMDFLDQWEYAGKTAVYYDWMVRDFLKYMISKANSYVFAPGTIELMALGSDWKSRAESAHARAVKACQYESDGMPYSAGQEWQKIFGSYIPL